MSQVDIADYNRRWLKAWTEKDVPALGAMYGENVVYRDAQVPNGVKGLPALTGYLEKIFAATPPITYEAEEIWPIPGGFCARWYATMARPDGDVRLRGFDMVLLDGDRIAFNEVYTHTLPSA
jgi:hypothetical protein